MMSSLYLAALGMAGSVSALLYDRVKRRIGRHVIILGLFGLWTVALTLTVVVSSPVTSLVPPVLFGLGMGMITPSVLDWVEELVPKEHLGSLSSYLASAGYLGQFLSPVLFGPVTGAYDVRGVFAAGAVIALLALVLLGAVLFRRR